ncbi:MAG: DUF2236 domain-containing protein [Myxococcales bacterium]|nr:DUF2236 domain-containing protein [Myxococcales bacterium]
MSALPERFRPRRRRTRELLILEKVFLGRRGVPDDAQLRRFGELMMEGDAEADALARWFERVGFAEGRRALDRALDEGLVALDDAPTELREFFAQVERVPLWLDRELLEIGARACRRTGPFGSLALRDVALMGGYGNSAINKPLAFTGALTAGAYRRLSETRSFWIDVTRPWAMARFGPGFRSAVHVRMMHGVLRRRIRAHPEWRDDLWGVPINQADMLATNVAFSLTFMHGLRLVGFHFDDAERRGVMHLWRYVGYLMGIDERLLVTDEREGCRVLYAALATQPDVDEDTRTLARSLMNEPYELMGDSRLGRLLAEVQVRCHNGMTHLVLGDATYRRLGLPPGRHWDWYPLALAPLVATFELARRATPGGTSLVARLGGGLQARFRAVAMKRPAEYRPAERLARAQVA